MAPGTAQTYPSARYEPLAAATLEYPFPYYRDMRDAGPVIRHDQLDAWAVTGHGQCRTVLHDTGHFASDLRRVGVPVHDAQLGVQSLDPPAHTAARRLLVAAMHTCVTDLAEHEVTDTAKRMLADIGRQGVAGDLVTQLARPLALSRICALLGVEAPNGDGFEALSNAIVRSMDAGLDPSRAAPGDEARVALSATVAGWLADPRAGGLISEARDRQAINGAVPPAVLANSLRAVLHAGYKSTSRLIGNALARLVSRPDLLTRHAGPADRDALCDELVRLDGPVQADARVCVADTDLAGCRIRRGDVVVLFLAAANRDPDVFPAPDDVDLSRRRGLHLSFGHGPHACLGTHLALRQLRGVLTALNGCRLDPVPGRPPLHDQTATLRGLTSLPVSLTSPARPTGLTGQEA